MHIVEILYFETFVLTYNLFLLFCKRISQYLNYEYHKITNLKTGKKLAENFKSLKNNNLNFNCNPFENCNNNLHKNKKNPKNCKIHWLQSDKKINETSGAEPLQGVFLYNVIAMENAAE